MTRYIVRRLLVSIPVLLAIAAATFVLIQALPGGPFSTVGQKSMPEPMRLVMEQRYGLDRPLPSSSCATWAICCAVTWGPCCTRRARR